MATPEVKYVGYFNKDSQEFVIGILFALCLALNMFQLVGGCKEQTDAFLLT